MSTTAATAHVRLLPASGVGGGLREVVARRHGRRRNPARTSPRSSLRTTTNPPPGPAQRWLRKVGRSDANSETPQPSQPSGAAGVALGAVRGRPVSMPSGQPRPRLLPRDRPAARAQPRLPIRRAQAPETQLPHAARARRGGTPARMTFPVRAKPLVTQIAAAGSRHAPARHAHVDGPERPSGRNASPSGITPSNITSPAPEPTRGSRTKVRLGARAHTIHTVDRAHASPA